MSYKITVHLLKDDNVIGKRVVEIDLPYLTTLLALKAAVAQRLKQQTNIDFDRFRIENIERLTTKEKP